jgi:hypothetical protein
MDLHIHTPASSDYRDPGISYLDILKKAEEKGLDLIAFADHNSVAGYAAMHREIETLTLLERLSRLTDEERDTLDEYRRLLKKIVVLPAFEFTATFGFHILGIFPENMSVRKLEHLLLNLNVPEEKMVMGAPDAGSTADVLAAYQAITAAGGLAIAAHANSSNGVAMQGFPFGGQTKIAYTQDPNLVALEVTDLESTGRRTTASFYNGSKTEYPRRMHCIQGSDAHSIETEQSDSNNKRLGVGARVTEILVRDASFASLKEVLTSEDFTRTRPYRANWLWDLVEMARTQGPNVTQAFHERAVTKTSRTRPILHDVLAFANGEGGVIYVGANPDTRMPLHGVENPEQYEIMLKDDIRDTIDPPIQVDSHIRPNGDRGIIVINVPKGANRPYVFAPTGQLYIRRGNESVLATRDDIVRLVVEAVRAGGAQIPEREDRLSTAAVGEPLSPAQVEAASRKATPAPAPTHEQSQRPARDERDSQDVRPPRQEPVRPAQQEQRAQEQRAPTPSTPTPAPPQRVVRPPALLNLPPEKIKGQIRPMFQPSDAAAPEATPIQEVQAEHELTRPVGRLEPEMLAPTQVDEQETYGGVVASEARLEPEQPRLQAPAPVEEQAPAAQEIVPEAVQPESAPEDVAPRKSSRTRSRRKAAETQEVAPEPAPEPSIEAAPADGVLAIVPTSEPMEATVAAEHQTREEIVAKAEKPKRGRRRASGQAAQSTQDIELQVDAPTAAASATEAGAEAILVAAELEPGPQVPGELGPTEADDPAVAEAAPAEKKGRSRRKTKAAAEEEQPVEAQAGPEAQPMLAELAEQVPTEVAEDTTPARSKRRGRSKKQAGPEAEAQPLMAAQEPPDPPGTGVEIISREARNGTYFHTMRDLRNKSTVHNVTRQSARRLWHYAILQCEHGEPALAEVLWHPELPIGVWRRDNRAGAIRYDLVSRKPDGSMSIYYGVTEDGLYGPWGELVRLAEEAGYTGPSASES